MKNISFYIVLIFVFLSCNQDFEELNRDPNVVDAPPLEAVFSYVEKRLADHKGSEWYYDNHQIMPWMQYLVLGEGNAGDVNQLQPRSEKYSVYYTDILPHLTEIRRQINEKTVEEQDFFSKLYALTYVVQVYHGLRVTDLYGSIPYKEAGTARFDGKVDPVYDSQPELFDQFHSELNDAIQRLSANEKTYFNPGTADFIYKGDWEKWIKLANAIKLRMATRLESQNLDKAKTLISEVVNDGRLFESTDDQFVYDIAELWRGTGGAELEWKGVLWAPQPLMNFMKTTIDPRIRIYFEPNGFHQQTIEAFNGSELPPSIDTLNDNQVLYTTPSGEKMYGYRYIGVPVSRNAPDLGNFSYAYNPNAVGGSAVQISKWNQRLLMNCNKRYSGGPQPTGTYVDVLFSYSEVCFLMAEFILKNYASGNAEDWYQRGIRASMSTYDFVAQKAVLEPIVGGQVYTYLPISSEEIENYLQQPDVAFDGTNDIEKVYIQAYIDFYRQPDEGFALGRRTGYPKFNSELLPRIRVDNPELPWPRRMVTPDPGDLNREFWRQSHESQGFSGLDESPEVLNSQRLWWDKNNPKLGEGG